MNDITHQHRLDGLNHTSFPIRSEMLNLFRGDPVPDRTATERVIEQIDRRGWEEAYEYSHRIAELTHTEESVAWVADRMSKMLEGTISVHPMQFNHLSNWFAKATPTWISTRLGDFIDLEAATNVDSYFEKPEAAAFEDAFRKVEFAALTSDELLARLEQCWEACCLSDEYPQAEISRMGTLCEALADSEQPSQATLEQWLAVDCDPKRPVTTEDYRVGSAMLLMQARQAEPPIEALLNLFERDWDWWNEQIKDTLVASNSERTLKATLEAYASLDWQGKLYLTGVFENLRLPGFDRAVAKLALGEKDEALRAMLAYACARYGTADSRRTAAAIASEYPSDPERHVVVDVVRSYEILLGRSDDLTRKWLREKKAERKRLSLSSAIFDQLIASAKDESGGPSVEPRISKRKKSPVLPEGRPARPNPHPGIGRNDPCPCHSGKKYKKCCLGKT